jgi:F0F1-type ATP synthase epsilon subunit
MANHLDTSVDINANKVRKTQKNKLNVLVYAPFRTYFDGLADSVTAKNGKGVFDILPLHHSFITLLDPGYVTIRSDQGEQKIEIDKGLMHVNQNRVTVFLDV